MSKFKPGDPARVKWVGILHLNYLVGRPCIVLTDAYAFLPDGKLRHLALVPGCPPPDGKPWAFLPEQLEPPLEINVAVEARRELKLPAML